MGHGKTPHPSPLPIARLRLTPASIRFRRGKSARRARCRCAMWRRVGADSGGPLERGVRFAHDEFTFTHGESLRLVEEGIFYVGWTFYIEKLSVGVQGVAKKTAAGTLRRWKMGDGR